MYFLGLEQCWINYDRGAAKVRVADVYFVTFVKELSDKIRGHLKARETQNTNQKVVMGIM